MTIDFQHRPHPQIAERVRHGPPLTNDEHVGVNGRIALILTTVVGTMWCAYAFAGLALIALPRRSAAGCSHSSSGSARRSSSSSCCR